MPVVKRYRIYGVEQVPRGAGYLVSSYAGQWKVGYRNLHPRTGAPWQSYKTKYFATEAAAWTWVRAHADGLGQMRSRGGSNLATERRRRIADASAQPRTPVTRQRFWFKPFHRRPPVRRRPLDEEARQEYAERDYELEQSIGGLKVAIGHIRDEIARDVYDQGKKVDYRHAAKGQKAFTPTGRRISLRPARAYDTAEREARARIRELNDELRAVRDERKSIADVMKHGELPGHYRKRLAWRRRRGRR